jgi:RNA polymerase sigma-70 factor, ECF subfamily
VTDDVALVERSRSGDRAAFDALVRTHGPRLHQIVMRYVRNEDDAKDVVQLALVRAFERIASFRGDSSFATWLCRIAINVALSHIRGARGDTFVPLEDDSAFTNALGTEKLVAAELWRKVQVRLAELPPKQRLVVELRLFHELSFDEIGVVAGCTEDAAKANYHHGVKRLRELLPGFGGR